MKDYDMVFLTNSPAFYKINLFNEISKKIKLLVIFIAKSNEDVIKEEHEEKYLFDYYFLSGSSLVCRGKIKVICRLIQKLSSIRYKKIIFSGWIYIEYVLCLFFMQKEKVCFQCESSIYESNVNGLRGFLKKILLKKVSLVMPAGIPHQQLFDKLNYRGDSIIIGGVGIFNKNTKTIRRENIRSRNFRYIYVGRLVDVKNLKLLVATFNENGKSLTIVGDGYLETELKAIAKTNISFLGFIDNEKISPIYQSYDIFILPSQSETWGLVVEEAIYNGLPVIVSDKVGANIDLVKNPQTGLIFKHDEISALQSAIEQIEKNYSFYKQHVDNFDFEKRDQKMVSAYINLINEDTPPNKYQY